VRDFRLATAVIVSDQVFFGCGRSCRRWHLGPGDDGDVPLGPGHLKRCNGRRVPPPGHDTPGTSVDPSRVLEQGPDRQRAPTGCCGGVSSICGASESLCSHDAPAGWPRQQHPRIRHRSLPAAMGLDEEGVTSATRTGALIRRACRRTRGNGGSDRSGTSAPWLAQPAAARRRSDLSPSGRHHRTSRDGCARSCRAGAGRPAGPAARGLSRGQWVQAWQIRLLDGGRVVVAAVPPAETPARPRQR
jgi:hypothetical protein